MKTRATLLLTLTTVLAGNLTAGSEPNKTAAPPDPGWPRQRTNEHGTLVYRDFQNRSRGESQSHQFEGFQREGGGRSFGGGRRG